MISVLLSKAPAVEAFNIDGGISGAYLIRKRVSLLWNANSQNFVKRIIIDLLYSSSTTFPRSSFFTAC